MQKTTHYSQSHKIAVLKFSGSLLSKTEGIPQAVHEIYKYLRQGYRILAVVTALDNQSDKLAQSGIDGFEEEGFVPPAPEFAELLATDETAIACLFTLALDLAGIKAKKLHHQCLITKNSFLNSDPASFTSDLVISLFERYSVLVLPGAIGYDQTKTTCLLGKKGADYAAIYIAWCLHADECVIYQETDGIYENENTDTARRYEYLNYVDLLKLPASFIHHKAIKFAEHHQLTFRVSSLNSLHKTTIGNLPSRFFSRQESPAPLKIALLGLGTVGFGVYKYLCANQHLFNVIGIGVNNLKKHQREQIPHDLISAKWSEILARDCDIVIELTGNTECSEAIIRQALSQGRHVITANRSTIAEKGSELCHLASTHNVQLLFSATIGGAIPIIETLQNIKKTDPIQSITGILNCACNFILDKVKEGQTLGNTLSLAKIIGLNANEPLLDIHGIDVREKAIILSRVAFGRDPDTIDCVGIQYLDELKIHDAELAQKNIRLLVSCTIKDHLIHAQIEPIALDLEHPLAHVTGIHNAILIHTENHQSIELHGKGAGRWPVAESVFADLLELSTQLNQQKQDLNSLVQNPMIAPELTSQLFEKEVI